MLLLSLMVLDWTSDDSCGKHREFLVEIGPSRRTARVSRRDRSRAHCSLSARLKRAVTSSKAKVTAQAGMATTTTQGATFQYSGEGEI
jgi:hypothetical protein